MRLRSGPTVDSAPLVSLSPGETGTVIEGPETADKMAWVKVQTTKGTGWMAEQYLGSAPYAAPPASRYAAGDKVVVDTDSVNLREKPGATEPVLTTLGTGLTGTVLRSGEIVNNLLWIEIESDYGTGWVAESFIAPYAADTADSREFAPGSGVYVNTDAINIRQDPGLGGASLGVLVTNATATILEGPAEADGYTWYRIESSAGTGWAAAQYLRKGTPDPATSGGVSVGDNIIMNTDALNIRAEPTTSSVWVAALYVGETATIIDGPSEGDGHTWMKIVAPAGEGWAVRSYMERVDGDPLHAGDTARVFDGELNLRASGSLGAELVAVLPDATYVEVLEGPQEADGYTWYRVSSSRFGTGWCAAEWLAQV